MQGRLEDTLKKQEATKKLLVDMPPFVSEYYYDNTAFFQATTMMDFIRIIVQYIKFINPDNPESVTCEEIKNSVGRFFASKETTKRGGEEKQMSAAYLLQIHSALKGFFEYLLYKKYIDENPIVHIRRVKNNDECKKVHLTEKDLNRIIKAAKKPSQNLLTKSRREAFRNRDVLVLLMLMNTGMRETALSNINLEDIDFTEGTLKVIDKGAKVHIYQIGHLIPLIADWFMDRRRIIGPENGGDKKEGPLFISRCKNRLSSGDIIEIVSKYSMEGLGYRITPHKLRAAFCTIMYDQTKDINFVKEAVGHANIATTQRYIVSDGEAKKEAANIMAKKLGLV